MEESILISTKKVLGLAQDYTAFDLDVITYINSAFSNLNELGIGPADGFAIDDDSAVWADLGLTTNELNKVKTYIYLKVRVLFDPPGTSFLIDALNNQIKEHEWRLTYNRESTKDVYYDTVVVPESEVTW